MVQQLFIDEYDLPFFSTFLQYNYKRCFLINKWLCSLKINLKLVLLIITKYKHDLKMYFNVKTRKQKQNAKIKFVECKQNHLIFKKTNTSTFYNHCYWCYLAFYQFSISNIQNSLTTLTF